jgi:hypothetical protein
MVMNSPENENGKTNLRLHLCQETDPVLPLRASVIRTPSAVRASFSTVFYVTFNLGLFYSSVSLDRSESNVLVSARLERRHPVNS